MWNLKNKNKKTKPIDTENRLGVPRKGVGMGERGQKAQIPGIK